VGGEVIVIVGEGIGVRVRLGAGVFEITGIGELMDTGVWDRIPIIGS
jgi:hypothetical protein